MTKSKLAILIIRKILWGLTCLIACGAILYLITDRTSSGISWEWSRFGGFGVFVACAIAANIFADPRVLFRHVYATVCIWYLYIFIVFDKLNPVMGRELAKRKKGLTWRKFYAESLRIYDSRSESKSIEVAAQ